MTRLAPLALLCLLSSPGMTVQLTRPHVVRDLHPGNHIVCIGPDACNEAISTAFERCEGPAYVRLSGIDGTTDCCSANGGTCSKMDGRYRLQNGFGMRLRVQ